MVAGLSKHVKPLVCFYQNQILYSENYTRLEKTVDQSAQDFLNDIEKKYSDVLKIVQADFDVFNPSGISKIKYYDSPGVQVYLVHDFKIQDPSELYAQNTSESPAFRCELKKENFCELVKKIVQDIHAGRFYQVNLTAPFQASISNQDSYLLFKNYFPLFNPKYAAYLPSSTFDILSYSPELFLKKQGSSLISRPIKGTTALGFAELMNNKKEQAELSMIVDLLRNDLHSVAQSPARVNIHRDKLQLPYTTHTYSEVEVQTSLRLPGILQRTMPGGSISGCPKIESLKAIYEYENYQRQFYTGTIGWWKNDDFELNISIRSFVCTDQSLHYFAGCGIVAESDPDAEWKELINKTGKLKLLNT